MRQSINILMIQLLLFVSTVIANAQPIEKEYVFYKKEKDITLLFRNIKTLNSNTTRELRADFYISAHKEAVLQAIKNENSARKWLNSVKEYSNVLHLNENEWYTYIQYSIPWPLNNKDCIIKYSLKESANSYIIEMNGVPGYLPSKPDIERISHLNCRWIITEYSNNKCKIIYTTYSYQKSKYPRWVTDPIIQLNLINTLTSLKEFVETKNLISSK